MRQLDILARDAGFTTIEDSVEATTANRDDGQVFGIDVVTQPLMPDGWFALRSSRGAMAFGPGGKTLWVPFGLPDRIVENTG